MRRLETPSRHVTSIHLAEQCKDESVLLAAGRWTCRFCDPRVKFQHREKRTRLTVWPRVMCDGKNCFNMSRRFPPAFRPGFQRTRVCGIKVAVADSLSRGERTSQTTLSQLPAGLSWELACQPAFMLGCGVYTTDQWLPSPRFPSSTVASSLIFVL